MSSGGALSRIEKKLNLAKENLNFYEAHQLYTTLYYRFNIKQKYSEARKLMLDGANFLFDNDEHGSGADLSLLYVESLEKNVDEISPEIISNLGMLHSFMPANIPEAETFEKRALMWSTKCKNVPKTGDKKLRKLFAISYWKNRMYVEARQNFLYAGVGTGQLFGEMLKDISVQHGLAGETDLFLTQAVLQLLCLQSYKQATEVFASYTELHPKIGKGPPFKYPLINFLCFLLIAIEKKQVTVFTILCDQYHISLKRDILYLDYLAKIGEEYFGISHQKKGKSTGFLENIMQSLFDDDENPLEGRQTQQVKVTRTMTEEDLD